MDDVNVKIETGQKELTIYTANGLDAREKEPLVLENMHISTPAVYLTKRKPNIEDVVVTYNKRKGYILVHSSAVPGEGETGSLKSTVQGVLVPNPDLIALKINQNAKFDLAKMKEHIKLNKRFFQSDTEFGEILKNVSDFEGKVTAVVKSKNDNQGNAESAYKKSTETNFNTHFTIRISLYEGFPPMNFTVELCFTLHQNGTIEFWFVSDDLQMVLEGYRDDIIQTELDKISALDYMILQ